MKTLLSKYDSNVKLRTKYICQTFIKKKNLKRKSNSSAVAVAKIEKKSKIT